MSRILILILAFCAALSTRSAGQDTNPFDLKRNKDKRTETLQVPIIRTDSPALRAPVLPESSAADSRVNLFDNEPLTIDTFREETDYTDSLTTPMLHDSLKGRDLALPAGSSLDTAVLEAPPPSDVRKLPEAPSDKGTSIRPGLFLLLFGIAVLILAWIISTNRGFVRKIYRAALNENFSGLLMREQRFNASQYTYYFVYTVFILNAGMFIYLLTRLTPWIPARANVPLLVLIGAVALVYLTRHLAMRSVCAVFPLGDELMHYNFNIILYNILVGIVLMPLNLLLAFGPEGMRVPLAILGVGVFMLLYLLRQFRGYVIGARIIHDNPFQFFVYLCAIEILPVLVVVKIFITS